MEVFKHGHVYWGLKDNEVYFYNSFENKLTLITDKVSEFKEIEHPNIEDYKLLYIPIDASNNDSRDNRAD